MSKLPTWDLSELYKSSSTAPLVRACEHSLKQAQAFQKRYRGKIAGLVGRPKQFVSLLETLESIQLSALRPYVFAMLRFAECASDPERGAVIQEMQTRYTAIASLLLFVELELSAAPAAKLKQLQKSSACVAYTNYLSRVAAWKPHRLSELEEQLIQEKDLTGRQAFERFFDQEQAAKEYRFKSGKSAKTLTQTELLNKLHDKQRSVRKAAAESISRGLEEEGRRFSYLTNVLLQDKQLSDVRRGFKQPEDARHLSNQIDPKIVATMVSVVMERTDIVQRFYRFKGKVLGVKKLYDYDRYAPVAVSNAKIPFNKARDFILDAFSEFSEEFAGFAKLFFDKRWIDAEHRKGKRGGAFCAMSGPELPPYVFINYHGAMRDVFTLAHELGHGIHGYLMRDQPYLNHDVPLIVAETASVFSEMLLFRHLRQEWQGTARLFPLYVQKTESVFATVFRQVVMYRFEQELHRRRQAGEPSGEEIGALWMKTQREMFGNSLTLSEGYRWWWSYIPHFIHSPFYVYAYAFGELLTLALFAQYEKRPDSFVTPYMEMLSAGSSKSPVELVKPLGVSLAGRSFWRQGMAIIGELAEETERLRPRR